MRIHYNFAVRVMPTLLLVCAFCFTAAPVVAGNVNVGKIKSSGCKRCHGEDGISEKPKIPNLAGQQEQYLIKAMKDYKNGTRDDTAMRSIVLGLSDSSIKDIAAYYSSIKFKIIRH